MVKLSLIVIMLVLSFLTGWIASRVYYLWDVITWTGD